MRATVIATWKFGERAVRKAGELLAQGGSCIDAVEQGIIEVENDVSVTSVGYGGLPNADGVVELDAVIMHGPTHKAGAVAGLRNIRNPISVARKVMESTKHVFLVGEGALKFAREMGFPEQEMLTDNAKSRWIEYRRTKQAEESHDTVSVIGIDDDGNITVGCSTSGIAFKLPGRVGDSPIIGSGVFVDNEVGAAAATGLGEEIMKFCPSFLIVEKMREGFHPQEACEYAVERILRKKPENRNIMAAFIALDKKGNYGGAATKSGFSYAVWRSPSEVSLFQYEPK